MKNYEDSFKKPFLVKSKAYFLEVAKSFEATNSCEYLQKVKQCLEFEETISECYDDTETKKEVFQEAYRILIDGVAEKLASNSQDGIKQCIIQDNYTNLRELYTKHFVESGPKTEKILSQYVKEHTEEVLEKIIKADRVKDSKGNTDYEDLTFIRQLLETQRKLKELVMEGFSNRSDV